jgi:hypothetical protein
MRVLAIDPGPHVGMAKWESEAERFDIYEFLCWEMTPELFYDDVEDWILGVDEIVIENFIIKGARASEANETIEMIGVVRYLCNRHDKPLTLQAPSDAMMFSTREKLERIGWWVRGGSDHARAASKHLLLYLINKGCIHASRVLG